MEKYFAKWLLCTDFIFPFLFSKINKAEWGYFLINRFALRIGKTLQDRKSVV